MAALIFKHRFVVCITRFCISFFLLSRKLFIGSDLTLLFDFLNLVPIPSTIRCKLSIECFRLRDCFIHKVYLLLPSNLFRCLPLGINDARIVPGRQPQIHPKTLIWHGAKKPKVSAIRCPFFKFIECCGVRSAAKEDIHHLL